MFYASQPNSVEVNYTFRTLPYRAATAGLARRHAARLPVQLQSSAAHHALPAPQSAKPRCRRGIHRFAETCAPSRQARSAALSASAQLRRRPRTRLTFFWPLPGATQGAANCVSSSATRAGLRMTPTRSCAKHNAALCVAESDDLARPKSHTARLLLLSPAPQRRLLVRRRAESFRQSASPTLAKRLARSTSTSSMRMSPPAL